jgi:hypothetical protein
MTFLTRFAALAALMVWQGGFIFYTAVVVPIGTEVLGSATDQGFITRRVTDSMNRCGAVALAMLAWEWAATRDPSRLRRYVRAALFVVMACGAATLFVLHGRLEALLDVENASVLDRGAFRPIHRVYLWVSTGQWAAAVAYLALTLTAWRGEDRGWRADSPPGASG